MVKIIYIYKNNTMKKQDKYFLYVRKSTEWDERQVQSLDDQLKIMRKRAIDSWYKIIEEFIESKSAKAPWREIFNNMIEKIDNWEVNWIIAWKLDRLSRNPVDSWTVQYMMQNWKIETIITNDKEYWKMDSWLLMSVENWMSNQYILDLSKNVHRWLNSKYEKWIRPSKVPTWYINDIQNRSIISDPERFHIVRKIWDKMLTWVYLPTEVLKIATNEWWLRTRKTKKSWWKELTKSSSYRILTKRKGNYGQRQWIYFVV